MPEIEVSTPSPPEPSFPPTLADLSRNASVISSSSSSESASSLLLKTPRPRPLRTFSSPRSRSPPSPRASKPPAYLTRELGGSDNQGGPSLESRIADARARSKSRNPSVNGRLSAQDFQFGRTLGEGSYSEVKHGTHLVTGQQYAIKILDKAHLMRKDKMQIALAEKNTLVRLGSGHPGIVKLHGTFQDEWSLFFVLDLAKNGELQSRISRLGSLSTTCARYYAAQIIDALDYMHSKGVIHRDLKPENVLLDDAFRIKITDFGTAKLHDTGVERTKTFVGTAQYVAPELLEFNETSKSSDLWALGCIVYQMIAGRFAFQGLSEYLTFQKVKNLDYTFPEGFDPEAKDLVQRLLVRNPGERLGAGPQGSANDMQSLRSHPFLSVINWSTLWTEPAPTLEAGLVKKEHPLAAGYDPNWDDVGASWNDLSQGDDSDDFDEIIWAADAHGPAYIRAKPNGYASELLQEVGPMGEIPRYAPRKDANTVQEEDTATIIGLAESIPATVTKAEPIDVPPLGDSNSDGTSSSDGSPVEKICKALEALDVGRGRNRAQTPVQGNGAPSDHDWSAVFLPSEILLFSSSVESRSIRRRASRLLPISVSPRKPKTRHLLLTSHRLLCLKRTTKGRGDGINVKNEFVFQAPEKAKDTKTVIVSVEPKGEKEFVVLTSSKSHTYAAPNSTLASAWIQKLTDTLSLRSSTQPQVTKPRT